MGKRLRVMLSVNSDDPQIVQQTMENFARVMTGLALEGVETWLSIEQEEENDE